MGQPENVAITLHVLPLTVLRVCPKFHPEVVTTANKVTVLRILLVPFFVVQVLYYERTAGEPWAEVLARDPVQLESPGLLQVEAACFSADGQQLYVAAEGTRTFVRYDKR